MEVSRMDFDLEKGSFGIDKRLPLATLDLLATIIAPWPTGRCRLDRLAVDDGGRRKRVTAASGPIALAQDLVDPLPLPALAPCAEVIIDHAPRRQVMRHHAPGDATPEYIKAAIKDPAKLISPIRPSSLTRRKQA
jgi:hypothetical protein